MNPAEPSLIREAAYVGGRWLDNADSWNQISNPFDGVPVARVPQLGTAETRAAIACAQAAFASWSQLSGRERGNQLMRLHDAVLSSVEDIARIMTLEQGKPIAQALAEVRYGASYIQFYAEEAPRVSGFTLAAAHADKEIAVTREPIGVTAAITPWNFPFVSVTRKMAPALAAGCTQVLKPAPNTPLTALALAALCEQVGLPAGVFNVITGDAAEIGAELTANPAVRLLTFTGSTAVGKLLARQCADTVKKTSLELGGHAPFIVFEDADVDRAVDGLIACKFRNMGQVCIAANRVYVHDSIMDRFAAALVEKVQAFTIGNGLDAVDQGPLANQAVFDKVARHVSEALANGARALCGGGPHPKGGLLFQPTVLIDGPGGIAMGCEETFGPVAPLYRFSSEQEVVTMANATPFGLAAYLFSRDFARIRRVARALECGMVGINTGLIGAAEAPFGGTKESGIGREGSSLGLEEFLEPKYLCIGVDP
jgi:succinate-semialdehyde dehydrogenase/glutarate-semialdehyde dehydrogenase